MYLVRNWTPHQSIINNLKYKIMTEKEYYNSFVVNCNYDLTKIQDRFLKGESFIKMRTLLKNKTETYGKENNFPEDMIIKVFDRACKELFFY